MKSLTPQDPRSLGSNRMIAVIGRGGMGRVLLGRTPTGRLVAVKQIHAHLAGDPSFRARFSQEVESSRQVTGAYTAAVLDSDIVPESPWLATEYIDGPDLETVVKECGPLHLGGLRLLAAGLASALVEIHRAGLVHRDLKPGNVLLTPEGPRVIDFGIARAQDGAAQLTATGAVVGSPAYMSPEQAEGRPLTPASDVFSVGAMLTMAATGASPFPGSSTPQILYNLMHTPPNTEGVPEPLRGLVDACLSQNPEQRPTAEDLLTAAARIPAEPAWPATAKSRIAAHRADSDWWVQTSERELRNREQLENLTIRRRALLKRIAFAAVLVLLMGAAIVAVSRWATMSGHAQPQADPSLTLTPMELQMLDACKVLDLTIPKLGTRTADLNKTGDGCGTQITDAGNRKVRMDLSTIASVSETEKYSKPIGAAVAWTPILGDKITGRMCKRSIITQSGGPSVLTLSTDVTDGDGCPLAQQGLTAIVQQLTRYVPLLPLPRNSILRVPPCSLLDERLAQSISGDPARREETSSYCVVDGSDAYLSVNLEEAMRPDKDSLNSTVQTGQFTSYIRNVWLKSPGKSCEIGYMARPTTGDNAELVTVHVDNWSPATDSCDKVKTVLADLIPRLPKS
ncbi:serine/threonine-protein kinase [Nocardia sp. NBC_01388]|uniref:serine/threonine-protein kinase n=1 Tax=Nocardia sp. NBC_01388 TaxID=2903596 RepID=UPI00324F5523